jgi:hypothetical protein
MNPEQFVDCADRFTQAPGAGAPEFRSATSRAYYGAYLCVRDLIETGLGISCRSGGVSEHQMLQRYLINCQVPEGATIGHLLANLHDARKVADYEMNDLSAETRVAAELNIARARQVIAQLATCATMAMKQKLKAGIRQYQRKIQ